MSDLATLRDRIACGLARQADFEAAKREDVIAIKTDGDIVHHRFVPGLQFTKADEEGEAEGAEARRAEWIASDETVDSMGDVISVAGWDLSRFKSNPVLLFAHDQSQPPIGVVTRAWKGKNDSDGPALRAKGELFSEDVGHETADLVWRIMKAGGLPGVSVGFAPIESESPSETKDREKLGLGPWGVHFVKQELLELSVVPVPANKNALRQKCVTAMDAVLGEELKAGRMAPDQVRSLRDILAPAEDRARTVRRSSVSVPDLSGVTWTVGSGGAVATPASVSVDFRSVDAGEAAWKNRAEEWQARAQEYRDDKTRLARTCDYLLKENSRLQGEAARTASEASTSVDGQQGNPSDGSPGGDCAPEKTSERRGAAGGGGQEAARYLLTRIAPNRGGV